MYEDVTLSTVTNHNKHPTGNTQEEIPVDKNAPPVPPHPECEGILIPLSSSSRCILTSHGYEPSTSPLSVKQLQVQNSIQLYNHTIHVYRYALHVCMNITIEML